MKCRSSYLPTSNLTPQKAKFERQLNVKAVKLIINCSHDGLLPESNNNYKLIETIIHPEFDPENILYRAWSIYQEYINKYGQLNTTISLLGGLQYEGGISDKFKKGNLYCTTRLASTGKSAFSFARVKIGHVEYNCRIGAILKIESNINAFETQYVLFTMLLTEDNGALPISTWPFKRWGWWYVRDENSPATPRPIIRKVSIRNFIDHLWLEPDFATTSTNISISKSDRYWHIPREFIERTGMELRPEETIWLERLSVGKTIDEARTFIRLQQASGIGIVQFPAPQDYDRRFRKGEILDNDISDESGSDMSY
jgi:hypothetical protein